MQFCVRDEVEHFEESFHPYYDAIKIDDLSEKAALEYLRDVMATWLYLLIEKYGSISREELIGSHEDSISALEEKLQHNLSTMDYYDSSIERSSDFRPKDKVRPEDVFESIAEIDNITARNVNDVIYAQKLVRQRKRENIQRRF